MGQDERHYNIENLNRLFAIASLVLLGALIWLFKDDFSHKWKQYQDQFRSLEIEKTRVKYDLAKNQLDNSPEYQELQKQLEAAKKNYAEKCSDLGKTTKAIDKLNEEKDITEQQFRVVKAEMDAAKFHYEEAVVHHATDLTKAKSYYEKLDKRVQDLQASLNRIRESSEEQTQIITSCEEELKNLERQKRTVARQVEILERKLKKIDPGAMSMTNQIASLVRDMPVLEMSNSRNRVQQIVLKDVTENVNFMNVARVDRCTTCHLGIDNSDYQNSPQPFKTHPKLELFLGKDSSHPMDEFGCTVCHGGRGRGTDFVSAVHTPSSEEQRKEWEKKYGWHEYHHWKEPMYAKPYIEAGCFKCHSDQSIVKGAEKLNLGLNLIEKSGCYACHEIEKYKDWPKPGPALTHLASKSTKDWTYLWIASPQAFRHNTRMPAFFGQSNNSDPESVKRSEQEIHTMVHYLFAESQEFPLQSMPHWGDAQKGKEIVASVGCFGCHQIQPQPQKTPTSRQSLLKEQGPNLIGLGSKTSKVWLYNWLKDPHRYHPKTLMPDLRLSDEEAADAAAYLSQEKNTEFMAKKVPAIDEAVLNKIVDELLQKNMTPKQSQQKLQTMLLDEKLHFAGQKLIGSYGCYSCHDIKGFENYKPIGTELTEEGSKDTDKLDFGFVDIEHRKEAWFTQKLKDPRIFDMHKIRMADEKLRMPNFYFSDQEIEAIVTALMGLVEDGTVEKKKMPRTTKNLYMEEGQEIVRQFNCQGCHEIEGEGGVIQEDVISWLVNYDNRSPEEANAMRLSFSPPNLIGEGKKVHSQWLFEFLHEPTSIRPWLKARMPTYRFNTAHLNALVKYFNAIDSKRSPHEFPFSGIFDMKKITPEELEAGQKLFSKDYFGCAQCHIVGDKMPAGSADSWAPNFALAKDRLDPEWIIEWMHNPQALLPGTKMPTYFDPQNFEGAGPEDILGGDENLQIKALRNYILTLSQPQKEENKEKPKPEVQSQPPTSTSPSPVTSPAPPSTTAPEGG
ncbi:MAG: c-type cytochrome [Candidatus Omnitrophica bacterium]|nr:c-type cytochrome [Candidatus Omnitrophota bacterium]